jgi:hypothetical protein
MGLSTEPQHELRLVLEQLCQRFPNLSRRWLRELARTALEEYRDAPIRTFVPLLVENEVSTTVRRSLCTPLRSSDGRDGEGGACERVIEAG